MRELPDPLDSFYRDKILQSPACVSQILVEENASQGYLSESMIPPLVPEAADNVRIGDCLGLYRSH